MADRFINDILSDGAPMVATARYTDQLFNPINQQQPNSPISGYSTLGESGNNSNNNPPSATAAASAASGGGNYDSQSSLNSKNLARAAAVAAAGGGLQEGEGVDEDELDGEGKKKPKADDLKTQAPQMESEDVVRQAIAGEIQWMLRFALLFVNFTFIVSALLLTLAGAIAVNTPSLTICNKCQQLARAPVILGMLMWFSGLFAFYWIKQRTVLFLLVHAGVVLFVAVAVCIIVIVGIVFNGSLTELDNKALLQAWEAQVPNVSDRIESPLCTLQIQNNCSGIEYGCCEPGTCYNESAPPTWVALVCPDCRGGSLGLTSNSGGGIIGNGGGSSSSSLASAGYVYPATVCEWDVLQRTTRNDMNGFIVVLVFAFILICTGMGLAMFVRKINNSDGGHD